MNESDSIFERDVEDEISEQELPVDYGEETTERVVTEILAKTSAKKDLGKSRIGVTKKVYRPNAEKKARRLAKRMRAANRRH
jgi:hypothetical protein